MKRFLSILLVLWLSVLNADNVAAVCVPKFEDCTPMFGGAQIDYIWDVASAIKAGETDKLLSNMKNQLLTTQHLQDIVAHAGMKGMGLVGTTINKGLDKIAGKKVTSASRLIEEPKGIDLNSEQAVQEALIERFLQYPSAKLKNNQEYEKIGEQFKIDTTLEMYIIAREMEKEIEQKLKQLEQIESCILRGEDCEAAGFKAEENCENSKEQEDELCLWRANLMVAQLYDQMMWYNEFLAAMQAQYQAVMGIGTQVKIREYQEEKQEKDANAEQLMPRQTFAKTTEWGSFAFADAEWFEGTPEEQEIKQKDGFDVIERSAGYTGSLAGKKETFDSLKPLNEAQTAVQMAIKAHNYKSQLQTFQNIYVMFHLLEEYRAKVREHWNMSEQCIRNYLGQYYQNSFQSWMGKECGTYEDKVYCPYIADDAEGLGLYDINCPNNTAQRCYVIDAVSVPNRSGLSGYLKALYDESKKQAAAGEIEMYLTEDDDDQEVLNKYVIKREDDSRDARKVKKDNPLGLIDASGTQSSEGYALKNPNNQDKMADEMRTAGKLNWLNGSLVAKAMVRDLNSKQGGKFGTVKHHYPLWNDQKEFYDQYINGKYGNMKEYIATVPLSDLVIGVARTINKLFAYPTTTDPQTGAKSDERQNEAAAIDQLENDIAQITPNDEIEVLIMEEKNALQALKTKHEQAQKEIKQKIVKEGDKIEELSTRLDELNRKYNAQDEALDFVNETTSKNEEGIRLEQEMYAQRDKETEDDERDDGAKSPFADAFKKRIAENDETWVAATVAKEEIKDSVSALEEEIETRKENIKQLQRQLDSLIKLYVKEYSDTQIAYEQKINAAAKTRQTSSAFNLLESVAQQNTAVGMAQNIVSCMRQKVIEKIEIAEKKLQDMQISEQIYYTENTEAIQKIHNKMIQDIMDMGKDEKSFSGCGGGVSDEILAEISLGTFVDLLMDMCAEDYCVTPEPNDAEGPVYFVGKTAKPRDFKTPTGPLDFASAPLREVFYFDSYDYENVEKFYQGDEAPFENRKITITGESFLNSGAEMPEVWKYILKPRPFVEKEIDLDELLNRGNPELVFLRSGLFPCQFKGSVIDAAYRQKDMPYTFGYNINALPENVIKQQCLLLDVKDGKLINTESDYAEKINMEEIKDVASTSELGQILAYVSEYVSPIQAMFQDKEKLPRKLSFNQAFLSALNSQENFAEDDESDQANEQFKFGMRALFVHNQFGDYLDFMEMDREAEEMLAKQKEQMQEIHQKIQEIFNEFGDTISDDFDLADEEDYDMADMKLDEYKNAYMRQTLEKLLEVRQLATVDTIQQKADTVQQQIELLSTDEDEIVEILGTEDMVELENKIKQQTANQEIATAYNERAIEDMKKQIRQLQKPYCAVYAK